MTTLCFEPTNIRGDRLRKGEMASLTIQKLARQAGVPPSTTARVLNGDESVRFDDIPLAALTPPPLTTVRVALYDRSFAAGKPLIDLLSGQLAPRQMFPVELIVRGSTASARSGQPATRR
ncbi:MAG: substrate-binding domain-containing protein [Gemmataceae bacterium]|nr:substrate-binding domain-containing protein [Gemmataceae bacterium]